MTMWFSFRKWYIFKYFEGFCFFFFHHPVFLFQSSQTAQKYKNLILERSTECSVIDML